jgi:hypothetical protein
VKSLTVEEIMSYAQGLIEDNELRETDVTVKMYAEKYGVSETTARRRFCDIAKKAPDLFTRARVGPMNVLRLTKKGEQAMANGKISP